MFLVLGQNTLYFVQIQAFFVTCARIRSIKHPSAYTFSRIFTLNILRNTGIVYDFTSKIMFPQEITDGSTELYGEVCGYYATHTQITLRFSGTPHERVEKYILCKDLQYSKIYSIASHRDLKNIHYPHPLNQTRLH